MSRPENWKELPVWVFDPDEFGDGYWVDLDRLDPEDPPDDPGSLGRKVVYAGFTWGEASDAENKFLCDIPIHWAKPVPKLVQLSTLPQKFWVGLPVYHPMGQRGRDPETEEVSCIWHAYDVGVVREFYPDPHFAEYGEWRVRFEGALADGGWSLAYSPDNLWVPADLAAHLMREPEVVEKIVEKVVEKKVGLWAFLTGG